MARAGTRAVGRRFLIFSIPILLAGSCRLTAGDEPQHASGCELYPIALSARGLAEAEPGTVLSDILNGSQPGDFGWLTWGGSPGEAVLVRSLAPPGDSRSYVNPDYRRQQFIHIGDWVEAKPGVSNSGEVREALERLKCLDITVPVWDEARGHGAHAAYRVAAFARVRLLEYHLPRQNRISVRFIGLVSCEIENLAPNVNAGADQALDVPGAVTLDGVITDDGLPAGSELTGAWSQVSGPEPASFTGSGLTNILSGTPVTNRLSTTATIGAAGTYVFRLAASDSQYSTNDDVVVAVNRENHAPTATPFAIVTDEDVPWDFVLPGEDVDGDALVFSVVTQPQYGTLSGAAPNLRYTPKPDWNGEDVITFKVTDGLLDSATAQVGIHVQAVNDPPVADGQSITNYEDISFAIVLSGSDVEGDPLSYQVITWPLHGILTPNSEATKQNEFTYTPAADYFGADIIAFKVSDGTNDSAAAEVNIHLLPVADLPVVEAGPDQVIILPTNTVSLAGQVIYDVFPGTVNTSQWSQVSGPGIAIFAESNAPATSATFDRSGVYVLRLAANDSLAASSDEVTITVNAPPTVDAGPDLLVTMGEPFLLQGIVTDDGLPTNAPLAVEWNLVSGRGTLHLGESTNAMTWARFDEVGTNVLRLTASDSLAVSSDEVTVRVLPLNRAPQVMVGPKQLVSFPASARLSGAVTDDGLPEGAPITLSWSRLEGPGEVDFSNPFQAITTATFSEPGDYVLRLSADDTALTGFADVLVAARTPAMNQAPIVSAGLDLVVGLTNVATLSGAVADDGLPQDASVTVNWSVVDGPGAVSFEDGTITNARASFGAVGTYRLRLEADDSQLSGSDEVTVTVFPHNQPPVVDAGPDQSITLPDPELLYPNPYAVTNVNTYLSRSLLSADHWNNSIGQPGINGVPEGSFLHVGRNCLDAVGGRVYVAGGFTLAGDVPARSLAMWDGTNWHAFYDPRPIPLSGGSQGTNIGFALHECGGSEFCNETLRCVAARGSNVFAGGSFKELAEVSDGKYDLCARWSGTGWESWGFKYEIFGDSLQVIKVTEDRVYLAGGCFSFQPTNAVPGTFTNLSWYNCLATWDGTNWGTLGRGIVDVRDYPVSGVPGLYHPSAYVTSLALGSDGVAYVAGLFLMPTPMGIATNIAKWNGQEWEPLGSGLHYVTGGVPPTALAVADNGDLYAGGLFDRAGGVSARSIARWDGARWWPVGGGAANGVNSSVHALVIHGRDLYAGGRFSEAGGLSAHRVAKWDGQMWSPLGSARIDGMDGDVLALAADETGIYVGGTFTQAGGQPANNIAKWEFTIPPQQVARLEGRVTDDGLPTGAPLSLTWTKISGPGEVLFADRNAATTTAAFTKGGTYVLRLTASDTDLSGLDEMTVTVRANEPPMVDAGPDSVIGLDEPLSLKGFVADDSLPDGASVVQVWSQRYGPGTVTFDHPGQTNAVARFNQTGTYVLRLSANDSHFTACDDVTVLVMPRNQPPYVHAGQSAGITLGSTYTLRGIVSDDGQPNGMLQYSWSVVSGPGPVTFSDANTTNTVVGFSKIGTYTLRLTANDSELSASANVSITVSLPSNTPPWVNAGPDQTITNYSTQLEGSVVDDGNPPTGALAVYWTASSSSGTVTFANSNSPATAVSFSQSGSYTLLLHADDGTYSRSDSVVITIPNQPPFVNAGPDRAVTWPTNRLLLSGIAWDTSYLGVSWLKVSGPGTVGFSPNNAVLTNTAVFSTTGTYVLRLSARDNGPTYTDELTVVVAPAGNETPQTDAGPDQILYLPTNSVVLPGSITDDGLPAETLLSEWTQIAGPGPVEFSSRSAVDSQPITTVTFPVPGRYLLRLAGTDTVLTNGDDVIVTVRPPFNEPPRVSAGADVITRVTNSITLDGLVLDDALPGDGRLTASWQKAGGPGAVSFDSPNAFSGAATNLPVCTSVSFSLPGTYVLRLKADDCELAAADELTVTVLPPDDNQPPLVDAGLDAATVTHRPFVLNGTVSDDGLPAGAPVAGSWSVQSGPAQVYFSDANALSTYAQFSAAGTYVLRLSANDTRLSASDVVAIVVVAPTNDPPLVYAGLPQDVTRPDPALLQGAVVDDGLPSGYPLTVTWNKVSGPGEVTFVPDANDPLALAWFDAPGEYVLRLTADDSQFVIDDELSVIVRPGTNSAPLANAGPDFIAALAEPATLHTEVNDDGLANGTLEVSWSRVSGPGAVAFSTVNGVYRAAFAVVGQYVLRLTAGDGSLANSDEVTVTVYDAPPPIAEIALPLDGAIVTCPTNIIGTASSPILTSYLLEYRLKPADTDSREPSAISYQPTAWSTLFSNSVSVVSNALGILDPTLSLNGLYELRLTATDLVGRSVTCEPVTVIFDGNLKLGHFAVSFDDLAIPVPGLPLQIVRTYDSRAAAAGVLGDFGVGWTLDLRNVRLQKNRPLGRNWVESSSGSAWDLSVRYHLDAVQPRIITITFPDGQTEKFRFDPDPLDRALVPIDYPRWRFTPLENTRGTLEPASMDDPDGEFLTAVGSIPGTVQLYDLNLFFASMDTAIGPVITEETLERYPTLFRYTSPEGTRYLIDEFEGLQTVTDLKGNTLLVGTNGLTWLNTNAGNTTLRIAFQRDARGCITNIIDALGHGLSYRYDTNANLVMFANRDGDTNGFSYDTNHRLLTLNDARGFQVLRNQYDGNGRLVASTDALGNLIGYRHDLDNRREYVTNRLGFVTVNEYDDRGNIIRTTDPAGSISSFIYDPNGNLLVKSNANDCACSVAYAYDDADNCISETDARGNSTTYTYNHLRQVLTMTEPSGFSTTNEYDAAGNLLSTRDSAGQVATFTYNKCGRVTSMTDPRGFTTRYAYNESGFLTNEVNALGQGTDYTVDANGNLLSHSVTVTRIDGLASLSQRRNGWLVAGDSVVPSDPITNVLRLVMRYDYSPGGLPLRTLYYDGSSTETTYENGRPKVTTDALGRLTECDYNEAGRLVRKTCPDGCQETFEYDAEGQLIARTDRRGFVARFEYGPRGKLIRTLFPDGSQISASYYADGSLLSETSLSGEITFYELDADGNRITVTDDSGVTRYSYDYRRHVTSKTDPLGRTTRYEYDGLGRNSAIIYPDGSRKTASFSGSLVTTETDQNGSTIFQGYDALGRLIAMTNAVGAVTRFQYDEQGNKIAETDPLGRTTAFDYDTMRRLVRTTYPDGSSVSTGYDAAGRVTATTNQLGEATLFEYDNGDRLIAVTDPLGHVTRYTYDCSGNRLSQTDPDGSVTSFEYDALNRRVRTTFPCGAAETISYASAGRMAARTDEAGNTTLFTYDSRNQLLAINDPLGQQTAFSYDQVGNRIVKTDSLGQTTRYEHDELDRLVRTRYPDGTSQEFGYDPAGRLTTQKDQAGKTSRFAYDAAGQLTSATDPLGQVTSFSYDLAGRRIADTDPNQQTTRYLYDALGRRSGIVWPDGSSESVSYDKAGLPLAVTDALGNATIFGFDAAGRQTSVTDPLRQATHFAYDAMGRLIARTDANNETTAFGYDCQGRLNRVVYPDGGSSLATYDAAGRRISETDPLGNITRYAYDALDRLTIVTDALGQETTFGYDSLGRMTCVTNAAGCVTSFEYDGLGRLTGTIFPDGAASSAAYDARGRCISRTDPAGNTTGFAYDDLDQLVSLTDALGQVTEFSYDPLGRPITITDAKGHTTLFEYDSLGRLTRTVYADGTARENEYDMLGRLIATIDQGGTLTQYAYDLLGRLIAVTNALKQATRFTYDPVGRLSSQTDANNHTTTFEYDAPGRRTKRILPGGEAETLGYDAAGNLIRRTDFNGYTSAYHYDALNRLTERQPDPKLLDLGSAPVQFTYTPTGCRATMTDAAGTTIYTYDSRDRLIKRATPLGSLSYDYDPNGNVTGIASSNLNGTSVSYEYDALNRLIGVNDPHVGHTTYTYDPVGNLETCVYPNLLRNQYAYDSLNRLIGLSTTAPESSLPGDPESATIAAYSCVLAATGHRLAASETVSTSLGSQLSALSRSYAYDLLYRLTNESLSISNQQSTISYIYDPVGNRLSRASTVGGLPDQTFSYDSNDRLTTDAYDANGNTADALVLDPFSALHYPASSIWNPASDAYDFEDRLIQRHSTISNQPSIIHLLYNGDGDLVGKTVTIGTNSVTTRYLVDDLNPTGYPQVLEEYSSRYSPIPPLQPDSPSLSPTRVYTYGNALISQDQLVDVGQGALVWALNFYGTDGHGNVRYLTDPSGNVTDTYDYDAFGNLIAARTRDAASGEWMPLSAISLPLSATSNTRLFGGEQLDPDLGLYYLRARYADPDRGRFWTMDSFEGYASDPSSLQKYAFNRNDPVNRLDPSGHISLSESLTVSGLAPMVRQAVLSLFDGANNFSYGLAGGNALKFTRRTEAYLIDSLAVGPGWKFGQPNFWAATRGAPFLLANNPNISQSPKPCWWECIPFDLDAPVYGPGAKHPVFEFEQSPLYSFAEHLADFGHGSLIGAELRESAAYWHSVSTRNTVGNWAAYMTGSALQMAAGVVSPAEIAESVERAGHRAELVMQAELDAGTGSAWTVLQGTSSLVGDLTGYNGVLQAGFGVDRETGVTLDALERWSRGLAGASQLLLTTAGLGATALDARASTAISRAAARAERKTVALAQHRAPRPRSTWIESRALLGPEPCLEKPRLARDLAIPDKLKREINRLEAGWTGQIGGLEGSSRPLAVVGRSSKAVITNPARMLAAPRQAAGLLTERTSFNTYPTHYVAPTGEILPATAYRYIDSKYTEITISGMEAPLSYFGFERFATGSRARDAFQIFYEPGNPASWSDARLRARLDTLQLFSPEGQPLVEVPLAGGGMGPTREPFTQSYPQYGRGGSCQLIPIDRGMRVQFNEVVLLPER